MANETGARAVLQRTVTRRYVAIAGASIGAAIGLGATRVGAQDATPTGTREIDTIHGKVTFPANAQRIISLDFPIAVALLELGVKPVGITTYLPKFPEGHASADGIPFIDNASGDLDLEKIASLKPDLIIGDDWLDPSKQLAPYKELTAIAPTLLFEWKMAAGNWEAEAAGAAEAIGKTAELNKLKADYEAKAANVRQTYADVLATYSWDVISGSSGNWFLYSANSSHGKVAAAAGVHFNAAAKQTDGFVEYSYENFGILKDTDAILMSVDSKELLDVPTFAGLPATKAKHVFQTEYFFPSSYGLSTALLEDVEAGLKVLAG